MTTVIGSAVAGALVLVIVLVGAVAGALAGGMPAAGQPNPPIGPVVAADVGDIPRAARAAYKAAAEASGVPWVLLAGLGHHLCDHGRDVDCGTPDTRGARGPMRLTPADWSAFGAAAPSRPGSPLDMRDAAFVGAAKLAAAGTSDVWSALQQYGLDERRRAVVLSAAVVFGYRPAPPAAARAILTHPRIRLLSYARQDIAGGIADWRILLVLLAAANAHELTEVVNIKTGHAPYIASGERLSHHYFGRATDISMVDGRAVSPTHASASTLVQLVMHLPPDIRPDEIGCPWLLRVGRLSTFTQDHADHLHFGFRSAL